MGRHLLIVDDDEASAKATGFLLRGAGYEVSVAQHFSEALAILETSPQPDLLITDIVMPNSVNGLALARMARLRNPAVRVIYISGYDIPGVDQQVVGPLMRKPLADDQLLATVAAQLAATGG